MYRVFRAALPTSTIKIINNDVMWDLGFFHLFGLLICIAFIINHQTALNSVQWQ